MSWNTPKTDKAPRIVADVDADVRKKFDLIQVFTGTNGKSLIEAWINDEYKKTFGGDSIEIRRTSS